MLVDVGDQSGAHTNARPCRLGLEPCARHRRVRDRASIPGFRVSRPPPPPRGACLPQGAQRRTAGGRQEGARKWGGQCLSAARPEPLPPINGPPNPLHWNPSPASLDVPTLRALVHLPKCPAFPGTKPAGGSSIDSRNRPHAGLSAVLTHCFRGRDSPRVRGPLHRAAWPECAIPHGGPPTTSSTKRPM